MNQREVFAVELQNALAELGRVERERNDCLSNWAELRTQLTKGQSAPGLTHRFEAATTALREHDARLVEARKRVREADGKLGNAVMRWGLENRMARSRSQAA